MTIMRRYRDRPLRWYLSLPVMCARWIGHGWRLAASVALDPSPNPLSPYRLLDIGAPAVDRSVPLLPQDRESRILFVRLGGLGDVLTLVPAMRLLRAHLPHVQIDLLVSAPAKGLSEGLGIADRVFVSPNIHGAATRILYDRRRKRQIGAFLANIMLLRKRRYDVALETVGFFSYPRWLALETRAHRCVAARPAAIPGKPLAVQDTWFDRVSDVVSLEPEVMSRSVTAAWETAKYVLAHDTRDARIADRPDDYYAITPTPESVDSLNRFRSKTSLAPQYAVLHPCAADPHKNWPAERFARVADFLIKTRGWDIVVTGTELDRTVAERLRSLTTNPGRVHLAVGEFAFLDLAALLAQAQLMVTVDTASMHLADMVGTPLLALFLPWPRYVRYLPFRQSQSVVVAPNTPADEPPLTDTTRYIDGISVERVLEALDQRLADRSLS